MERQELSILNYARAYGLTQDYRQHPGLGELFRHEATWVTDRDFTLHEELPQGRGLVSHDLVWKIDRLTAKLLKDVLHDGSTSQETDADELSIATKHMRMDSPLLSTDAELDYNTFVARHGRLTPSLAAIARSMKIECNRPSRRGTALTWPLLDDTLMDRVQRKLSMDRLTTSMQSLELLKEVIQPCMESIEVEDQDWRRSDLRMTSPLLPLSPTDSEAPEDRLLEDLDIPRASSPIDPTTTYMEALDQSILHEPLDPLAGKMDLVMTPNLSSTGLEAFTEFMEVTDTDIARKRMRPEDLKMEVPLTPCSANSSPFKKIKLEDIISRDFLEPAENVFSPSSDQKTYDKLFEEMIDISAGYIHKLENEQLDAADNVLRMQVPVVPDYLPVAPWASFCAASRPSSHSPTEKNAHGQLLVQVRSSLNSKELKWHLPGQYALSWNPIPLHIHQNVMQDTWEDKRAATYLDTIPNEFNESESFLPKRPGLRILDVNDEETLTPVPLEHFEQPTLSLLAVEKHSSFATDDTRHDTKPLITNKQSEVVSCPHLMPTANFLDQYFDLQRGYFPNLRSSPLHESLPNSPNASKAAAMPICEEEIAIPPTLGPEPPLDIKMAPPFVVVSTSLLSDRSFIYALRMHLPTTLLIERSLALEEEADIVATIGTGVVLTTLQILKQRPLPGTWKGDLNSIWKRLHSLAARYDTLVVLVASTSANLDSSDIAALNETTTFSARIPCGVQIILVPVSGDDQSTAILARWTAALVIAAQAGVMSQAGSKWTDALEVEHGAESILRAAGLNAFAALAVVQTVSGRGGMSWLASLPIWQRREVLESVIGVHGAGKVVALLDAQWGAG